MTRPPEKIKNSSFAVIAKTISVINGDMDKNRVHSFDPAGQRYCCPHVLARGMIKRHELRAREGEGIRYCNSVKVFAATEAFGFRISDGRDLLNGRDGQCRAGCPPETRQSVVPARQCAAVNSRIPIIFNPAFVEDIHLTELANAR